MVKTSFRSYQFVLLIAVIFSSIHLHAQNKKIRIACVGNSITYGAGIDGREKNSYPAQLQSILGEGYEVMNFGASGTTVLKNGNYPYTTTAEYKRAVESMPDIVFIKFGSNDSKLVNRPFYNEFEKDYSELLNKFRSLPSQPRVVLLNPVPSFMTDTSQIWNEVIRNKIIPMIQRVAFNNKCELINLYNLFLDKEALFPDKVHPNAGGATVMAKRLAELVRQPSDTVFNIVSSLNEAVTLSSFYGYPCADFIFNNRQCKIVTPKFTAKGHPWVWRARFWGHEPQADIAMLERGYHIVYCDVAEMFGNEEAIAIWDKYYDYLTGKGLAKKVALEGLSRGGVYIYNWAAVNPSKVACVYADNPVLDLKSWPGGKGLGPGSKPDWETFKKDYGFTSEATAVASRVSPVDKITDIVKGGYPMLHVCGDADEVVPISENTTIFVKKVRKLKGQITVINKPGYKHHPHSLQDPTPIVEFFLRANEKSLR